jgi:RHS repeat-associated protein
VPVQTRAFATVFAVAAGLGVNIRGHKAAAPICPDPMSASVTPDGGTASWQSNTNGHTATFTVYNNGTCADTYTISYTAGAPISGVSLDHSSLSVAPGSSDSVIATYNVGTPGVGVLNLKAQGSVTGSDGRKAVDNGYVTVTVTGPTPTSLLPYSANLNGASDGVSYAHATPAVGSMGTSQSLSLVYNSAAARPVSVISFDATGPTSPAPTTYQVQVQLVSNSTLLTLMNGPTSTSVFYAATPGIADRLTVAIDAKANGLPTGSHPVRVFLTTYFPASTRVDTISTRILVNDQTASPYGAGVGLAGIGRLYGTGTNTGRLLVDGSGAMEYFDRTCSGCAFISPAGESGILVSYGASRDSVFRLTALDGSFAEFDSLGQLARHYVLAGIQDLTFTWKSNTLATDTLVSVTDASGRGFTLTYGAGSIQLTDFAGRTTTATLANGLLTKVSDPDGGIDSLSYNANKQLVQLNSRTGGVWNYGYNALQQGDTIRAPSATDYTGTSVRPTTTVVTAAEISWQPSITGQLLSSPKGSIRADTVYTASSDPLGNVTKQQGDRFGLPTKVIDALGQISTITRDTNGNATLTRDPTGHVMTATYTGYFLTTQYDSATGQTVTYTYGRSTANQGANFGWVDPDGVAEGENRISLNATQDSTLLPASKRIYNILGDPTAGSNLPALDGNYSVQFQLTATTPTLGQGQNSTINAYITTEYSTNSGASWTSAAPGAQVTASRSTPGVTATNQVFTRTLTFSGGPPVWIRLILRGTSSGNASGGQVKLQVCGTVGPFPIVWFKDGGQTPPRLLAVQRGASRIDYSYHDGSQAPAGTLKQEYVGNSLAPGSVPQDGAVVATHYPNSYGQDTLVVDGGGHQSRWTYAAVGSGGNLLQTKDALGHVTTFHYNAYGLADTTTLANGVKFGTAYDSLNRVKQTRNGLGFVTQYAYGSTGLTRVTDPKSQVYKFGLNAWGAVVAQHDLGDTTKVDSLKYDAGGQQRIAITRRGDMVTLTYDQLGRLRTRSGPDFPAESLSYGLLAAGGSWMVASSSNGRDSLAYDKAGRLVYANQVFPGDTTRYAMSYTYDSTGHLINRSAPPLGSPARWVYRKALGVLDTMCAVGACTAITRDNELKPDTLTYGVTSSLPWTHALFYDSLHHITGDNFNSNGVPDPYTYFRSAWDYDSLGRVSAQRHIGTYPREDFSYDAGGQLTSGCFKSSSTDPCVNEYGQSGVSAYAYDSAGNRVDTTAHPVIVQGNRVTQFKGYALTYDLNGAIIKKAGLGSVGGWNSTDTTTLQWNAVGQLTRVEKWPAGGHSVITFRYDALGRRIGKTVNGVTTWFLYDMDQVEMDLDSATHTMKAEYGFAGDGSLYALRSATDTAIAIGTPTIGTVLGLSRARGGVVLKDFPDRVDNAPLFPWGQEPADTGLIVRYRLAGQEYDQETALYHMGARYYDPTLGRWLSEDPIGIEGGINLYTYAGNDPVNARDPSGLYYCWFDGQKEYCYTDGSDCKGFTSREACAWWYIEMYCVDKLGGNISSTGCRLPLFNSGQQSGRRPEGSPSRLAQVKNTIGSKLKAIACAGLAYTHLGIGNSYLGIGGNGGDGPLAGGGSGGIFVGAYGIGVYENHFAGLGAGWGYGIQGGVGLGRIEGFSLQATGSEGGIMSLSGSIGVPKEGNVIHLDRLPNSVFIGAGLGPSTPTLIAGGGQTTAKYLLKCK